MQFKASEDPQQGSLPPRMDTSPPTPHHQRATATTPTHRRSRLRHRCPLGCSHSHATTQGQCPRPGDNEPTQDPQPISHLRETQTVTVSHNKLSNLSYCPSEKLSNLSCHPENLANTPFYYPEKLSSPSFCHSEKLSNLSSCQSEKLSNIPRPSEPVPIPSLPEKQRQGYYYYSDVNYPQQQSIVPLPYQQSVSSIIVPHDIPLDFRQRAVQYMTQRLHADITMEKSVKEIENRIRILEMQIYNSSESQDDYITKLASRLAAILQHIDNCRANQQQHKQQRVSPVQQLSTPKEETVT